MNLGLAGASIDRPDDKAGIVGVVIIVVRLCQKGQIRHLMAFEGLLLTDELYFLKHFIKESVEDAVTPLRDQSDHILSASLRQLIQDLDNRAHLRNLSLDTIIDPNRSIDNLA